MNEPNSTQCIVYFPHPKCMTSPTQATRHHSTPGDDRSNHLQHKERRKACATVAPRGGARARRMRQLQRACALVISFLSAVWSVAWLGITARALFHEEEIPIAEAVGGVPAPVRPPAQWLEIGRWALMVLHASQLAAAFALARGAWRESGRGVLAWLVTAGWSLLGYGAGLVGLGVVADAVTALALAFTIAAGLGCMQLVYCHYRQLREAEYTSMSSSHQSPPPTAPAPPPPPPSPAKHCVQEVCADCV